MSPHRQPETTFYSPTVADIRFQEDGDRYARDNFNAQYRIAAFTTKHGVPTGRRLPVSVWTLIDEAMAMKPDAVQGTPMQHRAAIQACENRQAETMARAASLLAEFDARAAQVAA